MKIYDILDSYREDSVGILIYYEKSNTFIIELQDNLDEWTAPLLLTMLVRNKIFTVPRDISLMWVRERLIPPSRQNIGLILSNHCISYNLTDSSFAVSTHIPADYPFS